jgi:membrane protein YdbS with pleckstrin-like domain
VAAVAVPSIVLAVAIGAVVGAAGAGAVAAAVVAVGAVAADLLLGRRVRAWGFTEREQDLLVRRGVMFRRLSVVPYGRMQYVDVTAGPFERAFGLASVRMHTAAAASDARIPGLPHPVATRLRDQLSGLGESQATGL